MEFKNKYDLIKNKTDKKYNFGLGFLKMILTLDVICSLCYDKKHAKKIFINFFAYSKRVNIIEF